MENTTHNEIAKTGVMVGMPRYHPCHFRPIVAPALAICMELTMETRRCSKCSGIKEISLFRKDGKIKGGKVFKHFWCRECESIEKKKWKLEHPDSYKISYQRNHRNRIKSASIYRKNNPEKMKAYNYLNNRIINGSIQKKPCEICGSIKSEAHHDDYSKPLDVRWLCPSHHKKLHIKMKEAGVIDG